VVLYVISVATVDSIQIVLFIFEVLFTIAALTDTFIFALCFKECRLELLKIVSMCFPTLNQRTENLRYKVFNIQISENKVRKRKKSSH
jgi:hypothetical protein